MTDVTRILTAIDNGDAHAAAELLPVVYDELRGLAARRLASEAPGRTLQATTLVHEAYLRLVGNDDPGWDSRAHFFGAAAEAMRRVLIDNARARNRVRRGGDRERIEAEDREAETELLAAHTVLREQRGAEHPLVAASESTLVALYEAWQKPERAAQWRDAR